jgi:recombination protein RecA
MNPLKEVDDFIASVNKEYGKNTIYILGKVKPADLEYTSTGSLCLDLAIGGGTKFTGIPHGKITEIWGPKATGKSTLGHHIIANAQADGKTTAYFDFEHAYHPEYAQALGVDINKLLLGQYSQLEQGWSIIESMARTLKGCVIVVDSVSEMIPRAEIEGEFGDHHPGLRARLMGQGVRKTKGFLRENNVALVLINQIRHKMSTRKYERSEIEPGGEELKHLLDVQVDLFASSVQKQNDEIVSRKIIATVKYNKIARPYCKAEYFIHFGQGIDRAGEIADLASDYGLVEKRGTYFYLDGEKVAQGRDNFRDWLLEYPQVMQKVQDEIINSVNNKESEDAEVPIQV